jgi:hypothetical protein
MLATKLITARIRNTNNRVLPTSNEIPAIPLAPKRIAITPTIKNAMAALNISKLLKIVSSKTKSRNDM